MLMKKGILTLIPVLDFSVFFAKSSPKIHDTPSPPPDQAGAKLNNTKQLHGHVCMFRGRRRHSKRNSQVRSRFNMNIHYKLAPTPSFALKT